MPLMAAHHCRAALAQHRLLTATSRGRCLVEGSLLYTRTCCPAHRTTTTAFVSVVATFRDGPLVRRQHQQCGNDQQGRCLCVRRLAQRGHAGHQRPAVPQLHHGRRGTASLPHATCTPPPARPAPTHARTHARDTSLPQARLRGVTRRQATSSSQRRRRSLASSTSGRQTSGFNAHS